jgi:hypothetical protein
MASVACVLSGCAAAVRVQYAAGASGYGQGGTVITLVPELLVRFVGRLFAQLICVVATFSFYIFGFRLLVAYAPFGVDPVFYFVFVLMFHFSLIAFFSIRKLNN